MFNQIYDRLTKSRSSCAHIDSLTGKPMNPEICLDLSLDFQELFDDNWFTTIYRISESYGEDLSLSHILWKEGDKSITICYIFHAKNSIILVEAEKCVWNHFKERIGGYLYDDKLIKVGKPNYTLVDDKGNILDRNISI